MSLLGCNIKTLVEGLRHLSGDEVYITVSQNHKHYHYLKHVTYSKCFNKVGFPGDGLRNGQILKHWWKDTDTGVGCGIGILYI